MTWDVIRGCSISPTQRWPQRTLRRRESAAAPAQLAELARQAAPGLLVIYHQGGGVGTDGLFNDMRARYSGHFAIARDLDVF
jgi:hypothetical protein